MQFKDLEIGQRFSFINSLMIFTKCTSFSCERFLDEQHVFGDIPVIPMSDDAMEDSELIERNMEIDLRPNNESNRIG